MFASKLRFYSLGLVSTDKELGSHLIHVIPIEVVPFTTGPTSAVDSTQKVHGKLPNGSGYSVSLNMQNTIQATWMPMGSNRITSPDVVRNEQVLIWQYGDTDVYYWSPLGRDDDLRLLETVVWGIAAREDDSEPLQPGVNMYTIEASSHGRHITLRTTSGNGEPYEYTVQINTGDGSIHIADNNDNIIQLISESGTIQAKNKEDTEVTIEEQDIVARALGVIDADARERVVMRSPKMQFGEDAAVEPSVLGDKMAAAMADLIQQINSSQVIGNKGIPTSAIQAVRPVEVPDLLKDGNVYSKVNTNQ